MIRALAMLVLAGVAHAEPCEPSADVQSAIAAARGEKDATERLQHLVAAHPDDVFVHEAYADQASFQDYAGVRAQYKARYEQHPDDPRWAYLYARLVSYASIKEALALTADSTYPRTLYLRAGRLSAQKDKAGAKQALDQYQAACPDAIDGYGMRLRIADKKAQPAAAAKLRALLAGRSDVAAMSSYAALWRLEFGAAPPSRHAALRKQVAADLARMRTVAPTPALLRALDEGYKMTSDAAGQAWVKSQQAADSHGFMEVFGEWMKNHKYPAEKATRAEREAYDAAQFGASAEWVKSYPKDSMAWSIRLRTAPRDLPAAQVKAIAAELQRLDASSLDVPAVYAARGIDVEKVPAMVSAALAKNEREWANQRAQPDRFPGMVKMIEEEEATIRFSVWDTLTRAYAALHDAARLRELVEKIKTAVEKEPADAELHKDHQVTLWLARGRLALAERKKADALSYFSKARATDPSVDDDELRALWKELGGSEEALAALLATDATKPDEAAWKKKELALPAFTLTDLTGKTWKSSDLKGKTVLLVSWATWCGPCKQELPELEKLYQQTKKRADVVVASLNVDAEVGLVQPFMNENKYTFPVLLSADWASVERGGGIPLGWIADRTFTVRLEKLGYDPGGKWVDETLKAIDQVAKARE